MHEKIIESWNGVVKEHDMVFVLGDICHSTRADSDGGLSRTRDVIRKLNGYKVLVMGNHDFNDCGKPSERRDWPWGEIGFYRIVLNTHPYICPAVIEFFPGIGEVHMSHESPKRLKDRGFQVPRNLFSIYGHYHTCQNMDPDDDNNNMEEEGGVCVSWDTQKRPVEMKELKESWDKNLRRKESKSGK